MTQAELAERIGIRQNYSLERAKSGLGRRSCVELTRYLTAALFFCPRLVTESFPFTTFRPGFFCHPSRSSSPTGGFPSPGRLRIREVSARLARRPLSRKYSFGTQSRNPRRLFNATDAALRGSWRTR